MCQDSFLNAIDRVFTAATELYVWAQVHHFSLHLWLASAAEVLLHQSQRYVLKKVKGVFSDQTQKMLSVLEDYLASQS